MLRYVCHSYENTSPSMKAQRALVKDNIISLTTGWYSLVSWEDGYNWAQLHSATLATKFVYSVGHVTFISHRVQ